MPPPRLRTELRQLIALAAPVVIAELGWMSMGVVDTVMVGPLGAEAIGAVAVGNLLYDVVAIFGIGLLLGLDTLVSQAYGAGDRAECRRWLWQGVHLALAMTPPLTLIMLLLLAVLPWIGVQPGVVRLAVPYAYTLTAGLLPLLVYSAFRRYLQGSSRVRPVMVAMLTANLVNVLGNWVLIHGHWGAPALGVMGSGWATLLARIYMMAALVVFTAWWHRSGGLRLTSDATRPRRAAFGTLFHLGLPAASQILLELGVFATATLLAGRLPNAAALASHHIALSMAGVTFMVPLGISAAGAVSVGQALGRNDPSAARRAGWLALALGGGFMLLAGITFHLAPNLIAGWFSNDPAILAITTSLLSVAAVFQLSDGIQVVATGALRGAGDTRTPMVANLVGHWVLGLPLGYWLCFVVGWGVVGLWSGLSLGLIAVSAVLLTVWSRRSRQFAAATREEAPASILKA